MWLWARVSPWTNLSSDKLSISFILISETLHPDIKNIKINKNKNNFSGRFILQIFKNKIWSGVGYHYVITWMKVLSHRQANTIFYSRGIIGVIVHRHVINIYIYAFLLHYIALPLMCIVWVQFSNGAEFKCTDAAKKTCSPCYPGSVANISKFFSWIYPVIHISSNCKLEKTGPHTVISIQIEHVYLKYRPISNLYIGHFKIQK